METLEQTSAALITEEQNQGGETASDQNGASKDPDNKAAANANASGKGANKGGTKEVPTSPETAKKQTDTPSPSAKTKTTIPKEMEKLVAEYRKLYPKSRTFYVTSDHMVFLENDLNAALYHQRSLPDGEVTTINR